MTLKGDDYWVVLASRQDLDEAIGIAGGLTLPKPSSVARAENGFFAAISGPYPVRDGQGRRFLEKLATDNSAPKDAYLTKGASFTDMAWTPPASHMSDATSYDGEHDAVLRKGDLEVTLTRRPDGDGMFAPVAIGRWAGKAAFKMEVSDNGAEKPASQVSLVRLDPATAMPQVAFTYFWQGAHCCTVTKFATMTGAGTWRVVDGEALDGDGGYGLEDLENKGFSQLVSTDQSFYYAFDSYASSTAPTRIHELRGDKLVDVTDDPRFRHTLLQGLYSEEFFASQNGEQDSWHTNGFLAGWVASSMQVGRGDAAWARMLTSYDHQSEFGPQTCKVKVKIDDCPDDKRVTIPFPIALKQFLVERGYAKDPGRLETR